MMTGGAICVYSITSSFTVQTRTKIARRISMTRQDARKYYYQAKGRMWTLRRSRLDALFPDSYRAYAVEANQCDALSRAGRTQPR